MMNRIWTILILSILAACQQVSINIEFSKPDIFEINYYSKDISYKGESFPVIVTSNNPWTVESDSDWLSMDISSCEDSCEVTVNVKASHDKTERSGKLSFIQQTDTLSLEIRQAARPFIETATECIEVDGDGGTYDILFLANTNINVSYSEDCIRLIGVSSSNVVSFEVLRNQSGAREGYITLSAHSDEEIFKTILIRQGEKVPHPDLSFEEGTQMELTDSNGYTLNPVFVDMPAHELIWSSSDSEIAEVDGNGRISVRSTGQCIISAKSNIYDVEASITLNIKLKAQEILIMFGNQDVMEVPVSSRFVGEKIPVEITVLPDRSYSEDFILLSTNSEVAEFEDNILNCLKEGKTDIFIESAFNNFSYSFTVLVIDSEK